MSLKQWFDNGWIKQHRSSRQEVADLLAIVERDLNDASSGGISSDSIFDRMKI